MSTFQESVLALTSQIPKGKITTYGEIARAMGDIRAARAVGKALNENPRLVEVPCHRVVHSDGRIGGYKLGTKRKIELLEGEGIRIKGDRILEFETVLFRDLRSVSVLKKFREIQSRLRKKILIEDEFSQIKTVAGIDVSYPGLFARGSEVIFDYKTKEIVTDKSIEIKTEFPYIPTYLAFRELPVIERLIRESDQKPSILMIDGNGILHPRGMGIASHVGVLLDLPTIGVAKSLLCGDLEFWPRKVGEASKIFYNGKRVGYALLSSKRAKNPIYISPGHKISFETSLSLVKEFCRFKIPEPLRRAHALCSNPKST